MTPSGQVHYQDKLHLTPSERQWGFSAGDHLKVFRGPFGAFGIQVCFDLQFPEPSRLLVHEGCDIVFAPFSTDDEAAYLRVRLSGAARAVENTIYVVLSGSCGQVSHPSCLLNYSRSAILTPSDFGFPPRAVAAEAPAHEQTVAIADLDVPLLEHTRRMGSVRPREEIRNDIYEVRARARLQLVEVE